MWAPKCRIVEVIAETAREEPLPPFALSSEGDGYFSGLFPSLEAGMRYRFRLDDATEAVPDPASRFQPRGPHGPSEVIDPSSFGWSDADWKGVELRAR